MINIKQASIIEVKAHVEYKDRDKSLKIQDWSMFQMIKSFVLNLKSLSFDRSI